MDGDVTRQTNGLMVRSKVESPRDESTAPQRMESERE